MVGDNVLVISFQCHYTCVILYVHTEPDGPPQDITFALVAGVPSQVMFNFNPP